jgi:ABC-2 type transport system permease protein
MTVSTSTPRTDGSAVAPIPSVGALPGFGGLVRKELMEWSRGRRTWVAFLVSTLFLTLTALNAWLQTVLPAEATEGAPSVTDPMTILVGAVSGQIFVVVAVFAVMGILVAERDSGILAWTASKPVSRTGIWLAKFSSATTVLWIVAGVLPLIATAALVVVLYGSLPIVPVVLMAAGTGMAIALFVGIALAASTVVTSQAAVAAIAIGAMFLPQLLGLIVPSAEFLPMSILQWSIVTGIEGGAGFVTPLSWAITLTALVAFSVRRMERMEL